MFQKQFNHIYNVQSLHLLRTEVPRYLYYIMEEILSNSTLVPRRGSIDKLFPLKEKLGELKNLSYFIVMLCIVQHNRDLRRWYVIWKTCLRRTSSSREGPQGSSCILLDLLISLTCLLHKAMAEVSKHNKPMDL